MRRKAVSVNVDDVDVPGTQRVAFLQDARAFVHQSVEAAIHDFFAPHLPLRDFCFCLPFSYESGYFRIGDGAPVFAVFVPTGTRLLTEASHFAKAVACKRLADTGFFEMTVFFADAPANVETGEVSDCKGPHGHAEIVERAVNVLHGRSFFEKKHGLAHVGMKHAVADKAAAIADQHADFAELFRKLHARGDDFFARGFAADDFEQPHHVGRTEEVRPDDKLRPMRGGSNLVDAQRGRIAGENGSRLAGFLELPEDLDRKSTRLNSSHVSISYAVFCLKKKKKKKTKHK